MPIIKWTQDVEQKTKHVDGFWIADPKLIIDTEKLTCTAKIEGYISEDAYTNGAAPAVTNKYLTVDVSDLVQGGMLAAAVRVKLIAKQALGE